MGGPGTDPGAGLCRQNPQGHIGLEDLKNRKSQVLDGPRMAYEVPLAEVPTVLHLFCNDGGHNKQKVLFGCRNGLLGLADLGVDYSSICQQMETKSFASKLGEGEERGEW